MSEKANHHLILPQMYMTWNEGNKFLWVRGLVYLLNEGRKRIQFSVWVFLFWNPECHIVGVCHLCTGSVVNRFSRCSHWDPPANGMRVRAGMSPKWQSFQLAHSIRSGMCHTDEPRNSHTSLVPSSFLPASAFQFTIDVLETKMPCKCCSWK